MKRCTVCKKEKPASEFGRDKRSRDGLRARCKLCVHDDNAHYYHANKKASQARQKKWVEENYEKYLATCRRRNLRATERLKREVVEAYGGQCSCCGESDIHFLTLDHVNGRQPGETKKGEKMYRLAKREGFPKKYRALCQNCNSAFGHYGFCPHDKKAKRRYE